MAILVLVSHIRHGKILSEMLLSAGINTFIFIHGGINKKLRQEYVEKIKANKIAIVIGTSLMDEGFNTNCFDVIILASPSKSSIKLNQRIGRVLRLKPDGRSARIYDFIDTPKYLRKHYLIRRNILEKEFKITEQDDVQTRLL